jgi:hypothetical protein
MTPENPTPFLSIALLADPRIFLLGDRGSYFLIF